MKQKYKEYFKLFIDIVVLITTIISTIIVSYYNENEGYSLFFLFPIEFMILYFLLYRNLLFKELRLFLTSFSIIAYIRYVLMPVIIVMSGYYGGRSVVPPSIENYRTACVLMLYEFIVLSISIVILEKKQKKKCLDSINGEIKQSSSKFIYYIFFMITILATLLFPGALRMFSFINPRISGLEYLNSLPTNIAIVTYMLFTAKYLLYIVLISYCYNKYKEKNNKSYRTLAFVITIINISIFYGLNRSDLVITACASILLYMNLFKDKNIFKYAIIGIFIFFLITTIGESRQIVSISKEKSKIVDLADTVQAYFGGVYNVAISIETYEYYPEVRKPTRVVFDTFRPFIGINMFLKNTTIESTNNYFNKRLYFNDHTAQIVPIIGQGYIHFGLILSPVLGVAIICLAYFLENILRKTSQIEIIYFISICLIRMGFLMGQNTGNISNEISMNLVLFTIIYIVNKKIKYKKKVR